MNAALSYALAIGALVVTGLAAGSDPLPPERAMQASGEASAALLAQRDDRGFVRAVSLIGRQEVVDAQAALRRAQRGDVRSAAGKLRDDHAEAHERVRILASRKGWTVPQQRLDALRAAPLPDAGFDAAWVDRRVAVHEEAIALFRAHADTTQDDELKTFALATLPVLEHHLQVARSLQRP